MILAYLTRGESVSKKSVIEGHHGPHMRELITLVGEQLEKETLAASAGRAGSDRWWSSNSDAGRGCQTYPAATSQSWLARRTPGFDERYSRQPSPQLLACWSMAPNKCKTAARLALVCLGSLSQNYWRSRQDFYYYSLSITLVID